MSLDSWWKKKKCSEYSLTEKEKTEYNADSCCYATNKGLDQGSCLPIIKSKVKDEIKDVEPEGYKNVKIDWSSNWLHIGISLVLLVLLF